MTLQPLDRATLLRQFSEFLASQTGLYFPIERQRELLRGVETAAQEFSFRDAASCMQSLLSTPLDKRQIKTLASHLTVGETYFFREPQVFEALEKHILPTLVHARRQAGDKRLRLWSAGCATGEEAYSLAILAQRVIPDYKQWNITILGTDINPHSLQKAVSGIYGEWSFRNAPSWLKNNHFQPAGHGCYAIRPSVKEMVTFSYLNLMEESYPSLIGNTNSMDIIFCRNVLMYFEPTLADKVIDRHHLSLSDGGWLVVSAAEISPTISARFNTFNFPGAILHRKLPAHESPQLAINFTAEPPAERMAFEPTSAATGELTTAPEAGFFNADETMPVEPITSPVTAYEQALSLYQQGRYHEATTKASMLLKNQQSRAPGMALLARIHANQGDLARARHWCMQAIDADRLDPIGHYLMAVVLLEQGQQEGGVQELKRTLYVDPDFLLAHFTLGNLYRRQQKHTEANKHFENALALLKTKASDDILPESEGMSAGSLAEIIHSMLHQEQAA